MYRVIGTQTYRIYSEAKTKAEALRMIHEKYPSCEGKRNAYIDINRKMLPETLKVIKIIRI